MSEQPPGGGEGPPVPDDPFLAEDPAAREREARRLERERRRAEREARRAGRAEDGGGEPSGPSAGERASAALSGLGERISRRRAERAARTEPAERPAPDAEAPAPDAEEPAPDAEQPPESIEPDSERTEVHPPEAREAPPRAVSTPKRYSHATPPPGRSGAGGFLERLPRPSPVWIVAVVFVVALLLFGNALFQPFHGEGEGRVVFKVAKGASAGEVADRLDEEGVISSGTLFEIRLTLAGHRSDIYAGTYTLESGMSYSDAITELTKPPSERTIAITVPEGYSREQIAKLATDSGLEGSCETASRSTKELDPAKYGAKGAPSLEGFLFPATYELKARATAKDLASEQLAAFQREFKKVDLDYAKSQDLSAYDVLIIASMIDREVMVPKERETVSSVIYNRLAAGEPLGIDATIRYEDGNYTKPLESGRLEQNTPYNTYTNQGLPPTPIGNPGLAAIQAAAEPADTDYLFYVVKPGTCGEHEFTETLAEHSAAQERYNSAREAAGGKSPTEC